MFGYDSVQSVEYTITTPMLFATLLVAGAPTVPAGMVQWAFGCLTASHMLVIPVLYLSHMLSRMKTRHRIIKSNRQDAVFLPWYYFTGCILTLLAACALLQVCLFSCLHCFSYSFVCVCVNGWDLTNAPAFSRLLDS